jgi:hypothetical protein
MGMVIGIPLSKDVTRSPTDDLSFRAAAWREGDVHALALDCGDAIPDEASMRCFGD